MKLPDAMQHALERRARMRCEYRRMHQALQGATFHVEHVIPSHRGGGDQFDNLAWACPGCNLHKSDRVSALDAQTGIIVPLFNPRLNLWPDHFEWNNHEVAALTATGRATVQALQLNGARRILIRQAEELFSLFPPD